MAEPLPLELLQMQEAIRDAHAARLAADLDERLGTQRAREEKAKEEEEERALQPRAQGGEVAPRYWASKRKTGPVVGGQMVPRESYNLLKDMKNVDLDTALFWGIGHSWMANFGLTGGEAENHGETSRVRCMVSESNPPIILMELASVSTFNMLDAVLGADIQGMQQAIQDNLVSRSRSAKDYPLGYVLQGAGPHFCPGGNHHPVTPPGGNAFTMSTLITSWWNVQFREHALPGITAITGSAVGGGVAISVNTTQRVAAANASMSFGNLSRGASPLMWLSANLVGEIGMAEAVSIYLTDGTVSGYGALKAGLVMGVSPNIAQVKSRAIAISRQIASSPTSRLVCLQLPHLNTHRFAMEATGFMYNSRAGAMFANVSGKKGKAAGETAAVQAKRRPFLTNKTAGSSSDARGGRQEDDAEEEASRSRGSREPAQRDRGHSEPPRPFPEFINARPVHVSSCDTPCGQCGSRGMDGTIYGDSYYCKVCWPKLGLTTGASSASPPGGFVVESGAAASSSQPPPARAKTRCSACGAHSRSGQYGGGAYASEFYCGACWSGWRGTGRGRPEGAGFFTDVSTTDNDYDSGTDGTVINSDCVSAASVSDVEWW